MNSIRPRSGSHSFGPSLSDLRRFWRLELAAVVLPVVVLVALGLWFIQSASSLYPVAFHRIQMKWLGFGMIALIPAILVPYSRWVRLAPYLYLGGTVALVLVKLIAPVVNGSQRWIAIAGQRFQPSEFMKVAFVLMCARLCRFGRPLTDAWDWARLLLLASIPMGLILVQPDLGTSLLFLPVALGILWTQGLPRRGLILLCVLGLIAVGLLYHFGLREYQRERIRSTYQYSGMSETQVLSEAYQLHQSLIAVGNGGALGHGHGAGPRIQGGFLPYRQNDFVFAVVAEEHGFLGCVGVLFLVSMLTARIFGVARGTRDPSGRVLVVGIGSLLFSQSAIHVGVVTGLFPTTGMPFPFLSAGGSALLTCLVSVGLVVNVAINRPNIPLRTHRHSFDD